MKRSKFSDAQKAFVIRQGDDGTPVEEICRKAGISQATYFAWKKKYAGMMPSDMKRMRELEEENAGGSENRHILPTVSRLRPKTRAASRRLCPSTNTKRRTAA